MEWDSIASISLGGANLILVIKIIWNDLKHLDEKLDDHIQAHLERAEAIVDKKSE